MWPWSPVKPAAAAPPSSALSESEAQRLERLEAQFSQLQLQWTDTLDRIQRWAGRMAARERQRVHRDLEQLNGDESSQEPAGDTITAQAGIDPRQQHKAALRARALQIQRRGVG
jgi:hypothetical protein